MIEQAAGYETNELIHKIRSEHGTRTTSEGTSDLGASLQDELRSSESEGRQPSGIDLESSPGIQGSPSRDQGNQRTPKRRDSRERRTDTAAHQSDGGHNRGDNAISRAFQLKSTNDDGGLNEESKPSGLYTKPNAKEQRARETDQSSGPPSGQTESKKNFFSWLRSGDNGKTRKETKPRKPKGRPLTEKEIEELRPDLVEALQDGLPLLDQVAFATNKAHVKPYIFSSLDDEDIGKFADWWLKKARKSGEWAGAAKQLIAYHEDVEILLMVVPLFMQMVMFYKENGGFTLRGR